MPKYRKKPIVIEAVRYGADSDGSWYPGAVQRVAQFMLGRDHVSEHEILDVLQPTGLWDPPDNADLLMLDDVVHHEWLPLVLGHWVIKGVMGEFYPCDPDVFDATYEAV